MNSLSTVPSFHETFFFFRLRRRTRVSGGWEWDEEDPLAKTTVVVREGEDDVNAPAAVVGALAMCDQTILRDRNENCE